MKSSKLFSVSLIAFAVLSVGFPLISQAQFNLFGGNYGTPQPVNLTGIEQVLAVTQRIVNWIFVFLMVIAVGFILAAAFSYLNSKGESTKITEATKKFIFAAVAIAVGLIAQSVPFVVRTLIQ